MRAIATQISGEPTSAFGSRHEALEFVRYVGALVNTRNARALTELYSSDAVMLRPGFTAVGRDAIANAWQKLFTFFPDWTVTIDDILIDGECLGIIGNVTATDTNGWFGKPASGERIEYSTLILLTITDGLIVREQSVSDVIGILDKARQDAELRMAAEVQKALAGQTEISMPFCQAAGQSIACRAVGGDFFDLVTLPSGSLGLALGDVAGKGPAAALLAAMIQGMLAVEARNETGPSALLRRMNELLLERSLGANYATLVYAVLSGWTPGVFTRGT